METGLRPGDSIAADSVSSNIAKTVPLKSPE